MVLLAINNKRLNNNDGNLLNLLPELQDTYEYAIQQSANNQNRLNAIKDPKFGEKISKSLKKYYSDQANRQKQKERHGGTDGLHHYNNGEVGLMAKECPEGFVPGMLLTDEQRKSFGKGKDNINHNTTGGTIVIHNSVCDKHISPDELDLYLSNGWELGRGKERKIPKYRCTDGVNCMRVDSLDDIPEG